jgi:BlaI family transcriptional regulator, penicillinase repressor
MTKTTPPPDLSPTELDVLKELWRDGRASVREVHEGLTPSHPRAYSTTKTIMDRMVGKGLLSRKDFHGVFLYEPRISRPQGLVQMVRSFAERVLEVDPGAVIPLFARAGTLTENELDELQRLLDEEG